MKLYSCANRVVDSLKDKKIGLKMMTIFDLRNYSAVEKITFLYLFTTTLIILAFSPWMENVSKLLFIRTITVGIIVFLANLNLKNKYWLIHPARYLFIGAMLSIWYPETYEINKVLVNFDHLLANLEQSLFHFQPAIRFSQRFPQQWISELFNMGYFSYYPIIVGSSLYFYFRNRVYFEYFFFSVLFSFFCYYLIYILFPTAGPQYYFPAIGSTHAATGYFPPLGHYFAIHPAMVPAPENSGFFHHLVENAQNAGERPTAAFPSSHVGISTLIMFLIYNNKRYGLLLLLFPFYSALVGATVYIQAHYLIDVVAGLATAVGLYYMSKVAYLRLAKKEVEALDYRSIPMVETMPLKGEKK